MLLTLILQAQMYLSMSFRPTWRNLLERDEKEIPYKKIIYTT